MTIERLPGTPSTPTYMLHKLLESVDQIESLVLVVKWTNGERQVCWTAQGYSQMAMASIAAQRVISDQIVKPEEERP